MLFITIRIIRLLSTWHRRSTQCLWVAVLLLLLASWGLLGTSRLPVLFPLCCLLSSVLISIMVAKHFPPSDFLLSFRPTWSCQVQAVEKKWSFPLLPGALIPGHQPSLPEGVLAAKPGFCSVTMPAQPALCLLHAPRPARPQLWEEESKYHPPLAGLPMTPFPSP